MMLEGLTAVQVKLCDDLWACDTLEDVEEFIATLPPALQPQARGLQELMFIACLDDDVQTEEHCGQAAEYLERFM